MLHLRVSCHDHNTMDVTSHHLEIIPPGTAGTWDSDEQSSSESGEEISKRGESFGRPVGKGERQCFLVLDY